MPDSIRLLHSYYSSILDGHGPIWYHAQFAHSTARPRSVIVLAHSDKFICIFNNCIDFLPLHLELMPHVFFMHPQTESR